MFIVKKGGERPISTGTSQVVTTTKIKRENVMEKKWRSGKKGGIGEMSRRLETDYIQPQQPVSLFIEGRLKRSNVKGLQHFKIIQRM